MDMQCERASIVLQSVNLKLMDMVRVDSSVWRMVVKKKCEEDNWRRGISAVSTKLRRLENL